MFDMEITIFGSGGFQTIPRPLCQCRICKEARQKGVPYSRNGPSIFIKELNAIFDTPKDIINSINRENIKELKRIFYTHWHPDHTEGMRVVEEITSDWSQKSPFTLKNHGEPIALFIPDKLKETITNIKSPKGSYFDFFEHQNFAKLKFVPFNKEQKFNEISVIPKKINEETSCYLIKNKSKKLVYMPCDVKPFETHDFLQDCNLFIVGSPFLESNEGIKNIPENHPLRDELFSMGEIIGLIKKFNIKKTIITHIEEMWRLSFDEYKDIEKKYKEYNINFSFDGMKLKL